MIIILTTRLVNVPKVLDYISRERSMDRSVFSIPCQLSSTGAFAVLSHGLPGSRREWIPVALANVPVAYPSRRANVQVAECSPQVLQRFKCHLPGAPFPPLSLYGAHPGGINAPEARRTAKCALHMLFPSSQRDRLGPWRLSGLSGTNSPFSHVKIIDFNSNIENMVT